MLGTKDLSPYALRMFSKREREVMDTYYGNSTVLTAAMAMACAAEAGYRDYLKAGCAVEDAMDWTDEFLKRSGEAISQAYPGVEEEEAHRLVKKLHRVREMARAFE